MVQKLTAAQVKVPADVPNAQKETYIKNLLAVTKGTGRLHLFAGDQKAEHLNDDFVGADTHPDDATPEHLFRIAADPRSLVSVFAAQYGLISLYGRDYPNVPYLVKMNSKTHLVETAQRDPQSRPLCSFEQIDHLRQVSGLNLVGIGFTCYPGSEFEGEQYEIGSKLVTEAHKRGMLVIFWMYPRGKAVKDEKDPHLIAGVAGMAAVLGADFVKVNPPKVKEGEYYGAFKEAVAAAGRVRVITAGGSSTDELKFYRNSFKQITASGCVGAATGRNIHQKSLEEAVRFSNGLAAIIFADKDPEYAMACYQGKETFKL